MKATRRPGGRTPSKPEHMRGSHPPDRARPPVPNDVTAMTGSAIHDETSLTRDGLRRHRSRDGLRARIATELRALDARVWLNREPRGGPSIAPMRRVAAEPAGPR